MKTQHEAGRQPPRTPAAPPALLRRAHKGSIFQGTLQIPLGFFVDQTKTTNKSTRATFFSLEKGSNFV